MYEKCQRSLTQLPYVSTIMLLSAKIAKPESKTTPTKTGLLSLAEPKKTGIPVINSRVENAPAIHTKTIFNQTIGIKPPTPDTSKGKAVKIANTKQRSNSASPPK